MSIIYIKEHNECIYNINQGAGAGVRSSEALVPKRRYVSKYHRTKRHNKDETAPEDAPPKKRKPDVPRRTVIKEQEEKLRCRPKPKPKSVKSVATRTKVFKPRVPLTYKSNYGKLPTFVQNCRRESENAKIANKPVEIQPKCRYIIHHCRNKLLQGLKANWEEMQAQYQRLPILTDTIPKKNFKAQLEADMKQLEADIVLVERHPYIYVYPDGELEE